jgi:hypothetical protein
MEINVDFDILNKTQIITRNQTADMTQIVNGKSVNLIILKEAKLMHKKKENKKFANTVQIVSIKTKVARTCTPNGVHKDLIANKSLKSVETRVNYFIHGGKNSKIKTKFKIKQIKYLAKFL